LIDSSFRFCFDKFIKLLSLLLSWLILVFLRIVIIVVVVVIVINDLKMFSSGVSERSSGHGQPDLLQRDQGREWNPTRQDPNPDLQGKTIYKLNVSI
jgi:hypothetical protein